MSGPNQQMTVRDRRQLLVFYDRIDDAFIIYAADTLGHTDRGLTGSQIVYFSIRYAADFGVDIPITDSDFTKYRGKIPNKRTALATNLLKFNGKQQFIIIKELCELPHLEGNDDVTTLKARLYERYSRFSASQLFLEKYAPTGWERIDRVIDEMNYRFKAADNEEQYQAIGMLGRETLISVAQHVFDPKKHLTLDGVAVSNTDTKRMLEAYLDIELSQDSATVKKHIKSTVTLCNELTHDRNATKRDASLCIVSVVAVASMIKAIQET